MRHNPNQLIIRFLGLTVALAISGCSSVDTMTYHRQGPALPTFTQDYQEFPDAIAVVEDYTDNWSALHNSSGIEQLNAKQIMDNEVALRRGREMQATELYEEARAFYRQHNYESAAKKIIAAQVLLIQATRSEPRVLIKVQQLDHILADIYLKWGAQLARQAQKTQRVDTYQDAIDKYQRAADLLPSSEGVIRPDIQHAERSKKRLKFAADVRDATR